MNFLPVILGTDVNAYGIARSIHMAYGVKSLCVGQGKLQMTDKSKICDIHVVKGLTKNEVFESALIKVAKQYGKHAEKLILFAASDEYAKLVINSQDVLKDYYELPFPSAELAANFNVKEDFYRVCAQNGLDFPKTTIVTKKNYLSKVNELKTPIIIKPSNSVTYFRTQFADKKKAYMIKSDDEILPVFEKIYSSEYKDSLIVQEFIPGPDSNMRVLNAYVGQNKKVQMMALGQPLLEDVTPELIGNYVAIESIYNKEIYQNYQQFLEKIKYQGFVNFDIKYDPRNQKYMVFDINLRPGRSSFFATLSGSNIIKQSIDDLIFNKPSVDLKLNDEHYLWLGVPEDIVINYTEDKQLVKNAQKSLKQKKFDYTLLYDKDNSFIRNKRMDKYYHSYYERYDKWFEKKGDIV